MLFNPDHATTAGDAAVALTLLLAPYSLVGPFAGVLLDRWARQRVLVVANVVRAGCIALVAAALAGAGPRGPLFFGAGVAALGISRFVLADLAAALPRVVPDRLLVEANSLTETAGLLATLAGGAVGLGLRGWLGAGDRADAVVALVAAAGGLAAAVVAAGFGDRELLGPERRRTAAQLGRAARAVATGLAEAARHVARRRRAGEALLAITAHRFFYGVWTIAILLLYRNGLAPAGPLRVGLPGLTQVLVATGVGTALAALATPAVTARVPAAAWVVGLLVVAGGAEIALAAGDTLPGLLGSAAALGFVAQGLKISVDTAVQRTVAEHIRGRVFSFFDTLYNLAFVAAGGVAAAVLPVTGRSAAAVWLITAGYLVTAAVYGVAAAQPATRRGPPAATHRARSPVARPRG